MIVLVVETSVTNNSLSKDYPHLDDHAKQITDTPGFKHLPNYEVVHIQIVEQNACTFLTALLLLPSTLKASLCWKENTTGPEKII